MLRIGLTGGIASGKSTVADLFATRGVPVIDTDAIAREVVAPGTTLLASVAAAFGRDILLPDGSLNRRALRQRVFNDANERRRLEALLHPAIRTELERRSSAAGGPYQILVIPLLVEGGRAIAVDRVLLVDCPEELQIARLRARDGSSETEARAMLAAQASRAERRAAADDIIVNDGDRAALERQVAALHAHYLQYARERRGADGSDRSDSGGRLGG
ncbi:MAG: dephospho-CoA kinase [Steroidobacteraceae bacterium]|nr:dephospho-CoA kinase [Steroidobacteraceae bacterium]MDW8259102.1 dephospho-CoA kinase [Gammaproteobacteria bacterium]